MRTKTWATPVVAGLASLALLTPSAQGAAPVLDGPARSAALQPAVRLDPPRIQQSPTARAVFDLVNAERAARGLAPMTYDTKLELAAQRHSDDQARSERMSHTGSDGSTMVQRIDRVGFAWRSAAENVAYGYGTPAAVMAGWMNSDGHRRNILSSNTHIGVGLAYGANGRPYWTQVFATPR
ncbi:MAG: CAP domain-containing protein [Ilumatobacteraceae bacterium]|jgi:uncharacterized protein YkwD